MRTRTLTAALILGASLVATTAIASPAAATRPASAPTIVDALAASAADNSPGSLTDNNWNDLDILLGLSDPLLRLTFGHIGDRAAAGLVEALAGERIAA